MGKAHFLCLAAKTMRAILVDHARRHNAEKRRGGWDRITLQGVVAGESAHAPDVLDPVEVVFVRDGHVLNRAMQCRPGPQDPVAHVDSTSVRRRQH